MQLTALKTKIQNGEDSYTQFKVNISNSDKLAEELVAFSNARGGLLIIGVDDNGVVVGVENKDIRRLFAQSQKLYADEEILAKTDRMDINNYFINIYGQV